jgi:hypothetical protein
MPRTRFTKSDVEEALKGRLPVNFLMAYLRDAQSFLLHDAPLGLEQLDDQAKSTRVEIAQVLALMVEALNPLGTSDFSLDLHKRKRGRPKGRRFRKTGKSAKAASLVEDLVADGLKQEAAIAQATATYEVSRTAIYAALKTRRALSANKASLFSRVTAAIESGKIFDFLGHGK